MIRYIFDMEHGQLRPVKGNNNQTVPADWEIQLMDEKEFSSLSGDYPHRKTLKRSLSPVQYCKIETFSDCIQGTMKIPGKQDKGTSPLLFGFYQKDSTLILISETGELKHYLDRMRNDSMKGCTLNQFLLNFFELLIAEDVLHLQKLEERLNQVEEMLLSRQPEHFNEEILRYRKKLSGLHSYYEQLMNLGDLMQANISQALTREECAGWQLYAGRSERLHDHVEMLREYLLQLRELYQSQVDLQQNRVMSILTVVTTIFLPLTLIAGWYGMNFPGMPEFEWKYGYPAVIVISILIIVLEILYFKKKKML
ncbi:MAG: CorA family divalent cation transporter [Blautia sp.]|nr:CorA family divalent cation transporter [Blautia sp.]